MSTTCCTNFRCARRCAVSLCLALPCARMCRTVLLATAIPASQLPECFHTKAGKESSKCHGRGVMCAVMCLRQVDEIEVRAKVGSMQDGTVITVQGHGVDVSPVWRHAGMAFKSTHCLLYGPFAQLPGTACFTCGQTYVCVSENR